MGHKKHRPLYYKKSSSSSCSAKCEPCDDYKKPKCHGCKKYKCCCSSSSSSAFSIDACRKAVAKGNYHPRKHNCSSSSSSDDASVCKSTSATCNPCRYDIKKEECSSSSSDCCSSSSCCSSSDDCYSSSSSSCSSSSSSCSKDPYFRWGEKPIKKTVCKDGYKYKTYKWKYGRNCPRHKKSYDECGCKKPCCTKQYAGDKYARNDYHAVKEGKYDGKYKVYKCKTHGKKYDDLCPGCPPKKYRYGYDGKKK